MHLWLMAWANCMTLRLNRGAPAGRTGRIGQQSRKRHAM